MEQTINEYVNFTINLYEIDKATVVLLYNPCKIDKVQSVLNMSTCLTYKKKNQQQTTENGIYKVVNNKGDLRYQLFQGLVKLEKLQFVSDK